ncbi:MAG TPA: hypothetical protein PKD72_07845, partial [Gemmatales bacterium]|nr:hypothetical protein [Gemmatales bacterium]
SNEWYLGTGPMLIRAHWTSTIVNLGEETTLEIHVSGSGDLEQIRAPQLQELPGWEPFKVLIEPLPSTKIPGARIFRFLVRPRQQQLSLSLPSIRFLDPDRERWIIQNVELPPLTVTSTPREQRLPPGSSAAAARQHLPAAMAELLLIQEKIHPSSSWHHWLIVPPLVALALASPAVIWKLYDQYFRTPRSRWRQAAYWARSQLQKRIKSPEQAIDLVQSFLARAQQTAEHPKAKTHLQTEHDKHVEQSLRKINELLQKWQFGPEQELPAEFQQTMEKLFQAGEQ